MFAKATPSRPSRRDEPEKPFWISFSDLMTACMTVFLIVMAVTIVTMKDEIGRMNKSVAPARERQAAISAFAELLREQGKKEYPQVKVDIVEDKVRIDLGSGVNFISGSADLSPAGERFLRGYLPIVLQAAKTDLGDKWLKRVVVEGFTDTDGSYLFNLELSLQRSRKVICAMFAPVGNGERALSQEELEQIRDLFLVGGYSFNSMQSSKAKSRRVELKLEFRQGDEDRAPKPDLTGKDFGHC